MAAASVGALTRDPGAAATAAVVTAPKAARNSREAFASTLGRGLADRRDLVQLRPDALRLLDRVDAVVVDPRALATDELRVGRFRDVAQADRAEVWQWAQGRLEAGELSAGWHRVAPAFGGAARNGRARGQVLVYRRHDPRAHGVLAEIRRAGGRRCLSISTNSATCGRHSTIFTRRTRTPTSIRPWSVRSGRCNATDARWRCCRWTHRVRWVPQTWR